MDKLHRLQALTGQGRENLAVFQLPSHDPSNSGSDSDEYLTSGRSAKNPGGRPAVVYTPLGMYKINNL